MTLGSAQQNPADVSAAWQAYFLQYSTLCNQAGPQVAGAMPYGAQNLMNPSAQQVSSSSDQSTHHQVQPNQQQQPQKDYTDEWVEYYIQHGRADYAEQILGYKKEQAKLLQQQQQFKQPQPPQ